MIIFLNNLYMLVLIHFISKTMPDSPLYTDTQYDVKIPYNDNLIVAKLSLKRYLLVTNYARILHSILKETCFEYLLELPHCGDSNKYSKHVFYGEI